MQPASTSTTLDLTDRAAVLKEVRRVCAAGGDPLRGLHGGRSGRNRRRPLPGGERDRGRDAGYGLPRAGHSLGADQHGLSFCRKCRLGPAVARRRSAGAQGIYAITKYEGERAAACWEKHLIVRTCGLYARPSHLAAKNFVKTILRLARTKPKLRVVDDQCVYAELCAACRPGDCFLLARRGGGTWRGRRPGAFTT